MQLIRLLPKTTTFNIINKITTELNYSKYSQKDYRQTQLY